MSLNTLRGMFVVGLIVIFLSVSFCEVNAAKCKTSTTSECEVKCPSGETASAVCSENSKKCSCKCTTDTNETANGLFQSLLSVSEGRVTKSEIDEFLIRRFNLKEVRKAGPQRYSIGGVEFTIDID